MFRDLKSSALPGDPGKDDVGTSDDVERTAESLSRPMSAALKPLRAKIRQAARQLKPLAATGMPLVAAVVNPDNRPVPFSAEMMMAAMYGDPVFEFSLDDPPRSQMRVTTNGKLTNDHAYLSAVMVVRHGSDTADRARQWFAENRDRFDSAAAMLAQLRPLLEGGAFGTGDWVAVDLIETRSDAPRVPAGFATGPRDTRWAPLPDGTGLIRVS